MPRRFWCLFALWLAACPAAAMSFLPGMSVPLPKAGPRPPRIDAGDVDAVLVKKAQRRLYLMRRGEPVRTYRISLGTAPVGPKQRRGDNRTPEGRYVLDWRNPESRFTLSLHISYPNARDRADAEANGWDPGGMIMIHGQPRAGAHVALQDAIRDADWTEGCIAVSNPAIREIWQYTRNGTPIEIRP